MPSERASCTTKRVEVVAVRSSNGKLKARSATFSFNSLEMGWNKKGAGSKDGLILIDSIFSWSKYD